ncbi:MAG: NEW3 domain-containing protein, partial [Acidimicrobiia bacterium]
MRKTLLALASGVALILAMPAAMAQETVPTELAVTTPYVGVSIKPGDTATFTLDVAGPPGTRVALSAGDIPSGWDATLLGGGFQLNEVLIGETGHVSVDLDVDVPDDATDGSYEISVDAAGGGARRQVPLSIDVAATAGGDVTMSSDFPDLQGPADSTYSYTLDLDNGTPQEIQFGLTAEGPEGWRIDMKPSGEAQASTVTVGGGESTTVTVEVDPPDTAPAGSYQVVARADGGGETA